MFGRSRDAGAGDRAPTPDQVQAWTGSRIRAVWEPLTRRRGRRDGGVRIIVGALSAVFRASELRELLHGRGTVAESVSTPLMFIAGPGAAAPTSLAAEWMPDASQYALTVLVEPMDGPPPAVLTGAELDGFSDWVRSLPT